MLQWPEPQADKLRQIESFDNFSKLRNALRHIASEKDEWAGIPIPIDGEQLVIEPSYRFAALSGYSKPVEDDDGERVKVRNVFWSTRYRCKVAVCEREDGKVCAQALLGSGNKATMLLSTIGSSFAWGIEQESNALRLLAEKVTHIAFKQYMLTGMFLETSMKSGVTYLFRRLRPTVAIKENNGCMCVLSTLCMHPIGYYAGTWGGAMCPTDDVIAHLMLMRGDEPMFWRRCNQHPSHFPESGI